MDSTDQDLEQLTTLIERGQKLYQHVLTTDEPTNSVPIQAQIKHAMQDLEKATRLVSMAGLFSRNESVDEIATNDLQYLLLPHLLGSLVMKLTGDNRKEHVEVAEIYFKDFLQRCNDYGLSNYEFQDHKSKEEQPKAQSELDQLSGMVNTRANKIKRFRDCAAIKNKVKELSDQLKCDNDNEELKREYNLTRIKAAIYEAIEELDGIEMEKPLLEFMIQQKGEKSKPKRIPSQPLKPIIITKDEIQKAVFGAGYPSLPTMTVAEFYEQRVKDGVFPDPNKKPSGQLSLQQAALQGVNIDTSETEAEEKETMEEADDPQYLQRLRDKDEFKDNHRRGWGNRMNRS